MAIAALLTAFVAWERSSPDPLWPLAVLRLRTVRSATLAAVTFFTPVLGLLFFAPL
ncbi:hypothetical protein [Actinomadura soli]|uniref:hypothetical protein n=1 Tax=Actinomadura soli TaxID=2508997 RepID=UPI0014869964|nr:hypothetical protein [Actinomadura soli]